MIRSRLRPPSVPRRLLAVAGLLLITGCHERPEQAGHGEAAAAPASNGEAAPFPAATAPAGDTGAATGGGFQPLGSQAVKDAIHRALDTGTTQRWQDAGLSGYAVPSQAPDAHGCRAVRYTIDEQPERSFPVITACNAG